MHVISMENTMYNLLLKRKKVKYTWHYRPRTKFPTRELCCLLVVKHLNCTLLTLCELTKSDTYSFQWTNSVFTTKYVFFFCDGRLIFGCKQVLKW